MHTAVVITRHNKRSTCAQTLDRCHAVSADPAIAARCDEVPAARERDDALDVAVMPLEHDSTWRKRRVM
jgi:hypothetical protein